MKKFYPIMMDISCKKCIVVGGGKVAYRKISSLIECNATVIVISPNLCEKLTVLHASNKIKWINKNYENGDLDSAFWVFAATDNKEINQQIAEESKLKNIPVNIIDNLELCNFIIPSKIEQGDLTISISTNGKSPALSKKIKQDLAKNYGPQYAEFLNLLSDTRIKAINNLTDTNNRESFFKELVYSDLIEYIKQGQPEKAEIELTKIFKKHIDNERQV